MNDPEEEKTGPDPKAVERGKRAAEANLEKYGPGFFDQFAAKGRKYRAEQSARRKAVLARLRKNNRRRT